MSRKLIEDTEENIQFIKQLYENEKMTCQQIGDKLGFKTYIIERFIKRNGIKMRTSVESKSIISKEDKKNIVDLFINKGLSTEDIGKIYGVNRKTISYHLKKKGINVNEFRKDNMTEKTKKYLSELKKVTLSDEELIDLYCNQKLSASDIARKFDATPRTVLVRLRRLNIEIRQMKDMLNEDEEFREIHIKRSIGNARNEKSNNKRIKTNLEKYGVDNPFKLKYFQDKANETKTKNGTQKSSIQQNYLCNLYKGNLNYLEGRCWLDIAFPNEKIYIEYQGSGHALNVKLGQVSEEEFNKKEARRYYFLKRRGWKEIEIVSESKDDLPKDDILIKILNEAKEYLDTGHNWIKYDIDKGIVKCNQYEKDYDFGILRRIHKNDLVNTKEVS